MKSSETITIFGVSAILLLIGMLSVAFKSNHHVTPTSVEVSIGRGATNCHGPGICQASMRGAGDSNSVFSDEETVGQEEGSTNGEVEEFDATFIKNSHNELIIEVLKEDISVMDAQTLFIGDSLFFQPDTMTIKGDVLDNLELDIPYFKLIPGYYQVEEFEDKFEIKLT